LRARVRIDEELRRLAAMRDRWDELLGHLAMLLRMLGLWREAAFASAGYSIATAGRSRCRAALNGRACRSRIQVSSE